MTPAAGTDEPARRALEIEEPTNRYLIHPVSALLVTRFARLGVTPNAVSLLGMGCGLLAGIAYSHARHAGFACLGFALMLGWHVMDGADGQLARLTRSFSDLGRVLDGVCDYVTFTAVYVGFAVALAPTYGGAIWLLAAAAGVCHAVQAAAYEAQRQEYVVWGLGRSTGAAPDPQTPGRRPADRLYGLYAAMQRAVMGVDPAARRRLAALLAGHPDRAAPVRAAYRAVFAPSVHRWSLLSANYRTVAIFACALAWRPALYFWYEIVVLNLVLAVLLAAQPGRYATLFARLARDPGAASPATL